MLFIYGHVHDLSKMQAGFWQMTNMEKSFEHKICFVLCDTDSELAFLGSF